MDIFLWVIIGALFLLTYVGIVVPLIPDIPFMLGGFALYQFALSEEGLGLTFWIVTIILTGILLILEYIATGIAVKKSGGSSISIIVAMLGLVLFSFMLGPIGVIIGPFFLVFVFELITKRTLRGAFKVAISTFIGLLGGIIVKFSVITCLLIWFFTLT